MPRKSRAAPSSCAAHQRIAQSTNTAQLPRPGLVRTASRLLRRPITRPRSRILKLAMTKRLTVSLPLITKSVAPRTALDHRPNCLREGRSCMRLVLAAPMVTSSRPGAVHLPSRPPTARAGVLVSLAIFASPPTATTSSAATATTVCVSG